MKRFSVTYPVVMQLTVPWSGYTTEAICLVVGGVDALTVNSSSIPFFVAVSTVLAR